LPIRTECFAQCLTPVVELRVALRQERRQIGGDQVDDVLPQGEQGGDGARGARVEVVAMGPSGFGDQLFAAEFAEIVGGLPDRVAGVAGHRVDLGGELGDGESIGCR
jgi:hypothetical protein